MCPPGYHHNGIIAARDLGHSMYISLRIRDDVSILCKFEFRV